MWVEVERSREEIRRENHRFAVQLALALAAALAAGIAMISSPPSMSSGGAARSDHDA